MLSLKTRGYLFDGKRLSKLIIPLVVEQLLAVTIGIADTVMVASCGEAAVSGISLVDSVNILLINIFSALATGGAVVASQYLGRGEKDKACEAARQLLFSISALALVITVAAMSLNRPILRLFFGRIEDEVMSNAEIYFLLSALSYPFLAVYNAGAAIYRSMGNSKVSMFTSLLMNVVNISGNAILIYGLDMGVAGAGTASLVSRALAAAVMLVLVRRKKQDIRITTFKPVFKKVMVKKILRIGVPNGMENGLFQAGKIMVQSLVATLGTSAIAANAISNSICSVATVPCSAIGLGLITVVGQCVGANEYKQAKFYTNYLLVLSYAALIAIDLVIGLSAAPLVGMFDLSPEAASEAVFIIRVFAISSAIMWVPAFITPNALRASGDVKFTMILSVVSMLVFRIGFSYLFVLVFKMGVSGVWYAMYVDWGVRMLLFTARYASNRWQRFNVLG